MIIDPTPDQLELALEWCNVIPAAQLTTVVSGNSQLWGHAELRALSGELDVIAGLLAARRTTGDQQYERDRQTAVAWSHQIASLLPRPNLIGTLS